MTENPIIAEVTRGGIAESFHRGAWCIRLATGETLASAGDIARPIFPRSAIKALQALPLIGSGGADAFGLSEAEIALTCASHDGEAVHVDGARSILGKAHVPETCLACGAHWPEHKVTASQLILAGQKPTAIHNNCSGKHSGMLAQAQHLGASLVGYTAAEHPLQKRIAATLTAFSDFDVGHGARGVDGCSVPTWALPLTNLALAFARLSADPSGQRIANAVRANPVMVGGTGAFDTKAMQAIPRLFIKGGAEGVSCGFIPHAGIGFALKCDDGARRAADAAICGILNKLSCWTTAERDTLHGFANKPLKNWNGIPVGDLRAVR
jgi:L-asparaginase II